MQVNARVSILFRYQYQAIPSSTLVRIIDIAMMTIQEKLHGQDPSQTSTKGKKITDAILQDARAASAAELTIQRRA